MGLMAAFIPVALSVERSLDPVKISANLALIDRLARGQTNSQRFLIAYAEEPANIVANSRETPSNSMHFLTLLCSNLVSLF